MTRSESGIARKVALHALLEAACKSPTIKAAARVALVVGTALNLINQSPQILAGDAINLWHLTLNYLVPYCVSSYSAASNELRRRT